MRQKRQSVPDEMTRILNDATEKEFLRQLKLFLERMEWDPIREKIPYLLSQKSTQLFDLSFKDIMGDIDESKPLIDLNIDLRKKKS